jgi:predicted RNA methylase
MSDFIKNTMDWSTDDGINLPMLNDFMRNQFYDNVLRNRVNDKHCLDIGFGTGLLSILALKHGAKSITAYESDNNRYLLGCEIIKRLELENKITLIHNRYKHDDFNKHNSNVIFTETVNGGLWNEGIWKSLPRKSGIQFLPGQYYLDIIGLEIPESFANGLINEVSDQVYFSPGIDIDTKFVECVNNLSNKKNNLDISLCVDGITELSNINTIWSWMPYMRLAAYNGKSIAKYTVDAIENTITTTDQMGTNKAVIDFAINNIDISINTEGFHNKCVLLIPRIGMKHGDANLILDTGHWGPVDYPVLLKNIQSSTVTVSHHIETGYLRYT